MKKLFTTTMVALTVLLTSNIGFAQIDSDLIIDADLTSNNRVRIYDGAPYVSKTVSLSNISGSNGVQLKVLGKPYRSNRRSQSLKIRHAGGNLYVVERQTYSFGGPVLNPIPAERTFQAIAALDVLSQGSSGIFIQVLVPVGIELEATPIVDATMHTCLAYFQGFTYDAQSDSCVVDGASGCSNPFEFTTIDQCETANLLN